MTAARVRAWRPILSDGSLDPAELALPPSARGRWLWTLGGDPFSDLGDPADADLLHAVMASSHGAFSMGVRRPGLRAAWLAALEAEGRWMTDAPTHGAPPTPALLALYARAEARAGAVRGRGMPRCLWQPWPLRNVRVAEGEAAEAHPGPRRPTAPRAGGDAELIAECARAIASMRRTGAPLIASARPGMVRLYWDPRRAASRAASPSIGHAPEAYVASVAGRPVDARAARRLMASGAVESGRGWRLRVRCRLGTEAAIAAALTPLSGHLAAIAAAPDAEGLEDAFQAALGAGPERLRRRAGAAGSRIRGAVVRRGRELCAASPEGPAVSAPGPRRRMRADGAEAAARELAVAAGCAAGLGREEALAEWEWCRGYPHRSLRILEERAAGGAGTGMAAG